AKQSSLEDWQKEARKLELQGKQEQVDAIRRDILRQSPVPWPVFDQAKTTELLIKVFRERAPGGKPRQQLFDIAPCVRGIFPRRLRVDGRVHCAGVLDVHASGRGLAVRASLARPEKSDPIPCAARSGDASAFLRHGGVSPLFEPLICRCRSTVECRDILGRHPDIPPWPARDRKK